MTKEKTQNQGRTDARQASGFQRIAEAEIRKWVWGVPINSLDKIAGQLVAAYDAGKTLDIDKLRELARTTRAKMLSRIIQNATTGVKEGDGWKATVDAQHAIEQVFQLSDSYRQGVTRFIENTRRKAR
ncbi:MAG TPA: hypothetical protein VJ464_17995 [Blastocatellia bacterium]|nr:hypothetical protein [Blastocatellia bacterium]